MELMKRLLTTDSVCTVGVDMPRRDAASFSGLEFPFFGRANVFPRFFGRANVFPRFFGPQNCPNMTRLIAHINRWAIMGAFFACNASKGGGVLLRKKRKIVEVFSLFIMKASDFWHSTENSQCHCWEKSMPYCLWTTRDFQSGYLVH